MHSDVQVGQCLFGCVDSEDSISHYLCCPSLWALARKCLGVAETHISVPHRLSIVEPSKSKLIFRTYSHIMFHSAINDKECLKLALDGDFSRLQRRVVSLGRQVRHRFPTL